MKVKKKFYWIHLRFLLILTILSIFVCWWGWHISKLNDATPFARSGAIATAILIAFLVSNYSERLAQVKRDVMNEFDKSGNWTNASAAVREKLASDIKKITDFTEAIIRYWYATLMFLATIIWGLGDLFYVLVLHHPALTTCEIASRLIHLTSP